MGAFFFEITVVLCLASFLSIVFRILRQPPILAYILTGVLLGPVALLHINNLDYIRSFAEIGITLLLFTLGLELKFSELRSVGKTAIIAGLLQIFITGVLSYFLSTLLGFSSTESIYIALALTFSSTIIIVKLLSDKKDLQSLYGKIAVGILLVQDFAAILALVLLSGIGAENSLPGAQELFILALKVIALFGWTYVLGITILPYIVRRIARSPETLFLFSLAFVFGMSALVSSSLIGFSIEIGGFLAGLALANTSENYQISARVRSLRDFFIILFFALLGIQMVFVRDLSLAIPIGILVLFVFLVKPLIVMATLGLLKYRKRTSFLTATPFAQISEFSFVILFTGNTLGHVSDSTMSMVIAVGSITFITSSYFIISSNWIYKNLSPYLGFFERKEASEKRISGMNLSNHIVLVGAKRMGEKILETLRKEEDAKIAVVDFDPDIIEALRKDGINSIFGDISDPEILEVVCADKAKLIISTVSDLEDNIFLLRSIKEVKNKPKVILMALEKEDAAELYKEGADYVVLPHISGGHHLAKMLMDKDKIEQIEKYKEKDMKEITTSA